VSAIPLKDVLCDCLDAHAQLAAGLDRIRAQDSEDGYEMHFAVNHLGHFLLVNELLPLLESSSDGRVVLVGSSLHYFATELDFDDLMASSLQVIICSAAAALLFLLTSMLPLPQTSKNYHMFRAYSRSKLAVMMYALELQNRLAQGSSCKTLVAVANPGLVVSSTEHSWFSLVLISHLRCVLHDRSVNFHFERHGMVHATGRCDCVSYS
jgi:NAD(P)-dependent dehydrogenase (short-subunit alcohol dehydrogenase family)